MDSSTLTYEDVITKQLIEEWAEKIEFDVSEHLCLHLYELLGVDGAHVVSAVNKGDFLLLELTAKSWPEPREFGLLSNGSLFW